MSKDLQYYLDNPDELPDDPALLVELAGRINTPVVGSESDETAATSSGEAKKVDEEKTQEQVAVTKTEEANKTTEEEGADILTQDGKHAIPYSVLKSEREKRLAAETQVNELATQLTAIQAQLAKGTATSEAKAAELGKEAMEALSPEDLESIRIDFPSFGKVIDTLMSKVGELTGKLQQLETTEQVRAVDNQRAVAETVQDHIDNEPVLAHLQAEKPELFAKAIEFDNALKGDARYPTMAERFAKVSQLMEATFGPFEGVTKTPVKTADTSTQVDKQAARESVQKKVAETKVTPKSLSDIPAGDPPESDERAQLESLSAAEISDRLMKMSDEQRTSFLKRF